MVRPLASSLASLFLTAAALGCTAGPTSLGEPHDSETSSSTAGSSEGLEGTGPVTTQDDVGTSEGSTTLADSSTTDGSTSDNSTTDGTTTDGTTTDGTTTGEPLDAAMVVFVNFDGVTLSEAGVDDATADESTIASQFGGMPLAPWGNGPKRAQVMAELPGYWAPFDVAFTTTRPASGDYTMIVMSPTNPFGGGVRGISPLDCDNANLRTVGIVFGSIDDGLPAAEVAAIISHITGDGMGLEHTNGGGLTDPILLNGAAFVDACVPILGTPTCVAQHAPFCPAGQQNGFAELEAWFPL